MHRALALAGLAFLLVAGTVYQSGRGTVEDVVILPFLDQPPQGVPHIGVVAPDEGRLLFLFATGHSSGTGSGNVTYAAVRADGGVACSIEVPCTVEDGEHVPNDGGVALCGASVADMEHLDFQPISGCATQPDVFIQAAFYYK